MLESNGSTSMATVCGASMSLLDAGVPITAPVAGISIGMVSEGDQFVLLTDILGEEDFHGDMDFKVAGTKNGITGIQLDMKARGISQDKIIPTLDAARNARLCILEQMTAVLDGPRSDISKYAPRLYTLSINPSKIGKVIGPGGKMIKRIQEETGATIEIEDDGTVYIASSDSESAQAAMGQVRALTEEVELGKIYDGKVVSIRDFGVFVEILPGQDGLCHVSELDNKYVKKADDVCDIGDTLQVKVIGIDDQGKIRLSRKVLLPKLEEEEKSGS